MTSAKVLRVELSEYCRRNRLGVHFIEQVTIHCSRGDAPIQRSLVRASRFEYEKRFWIICAIYFTGFFLSAFDHISFIAALRHLIAPSVAAGSTQATMFARAVIAAGSLLVFFAAATR